MPDAEPDIMISRKQPFLLLVFSSFLITTALLLLLLGFYAFVQYDAMALSLAAARPPPFYVANEGNTNNTTTNATDMSSLVTYTNSTYGIALQHPITWDVYDAFNNTNTTLLIVADVISPLSVDPTQETNVYITLDKIFQNSSSSIHLGGYARYAVNSLRDQYGKNFTIISATDSMLAGHNAYTLVYTLLAPDGTPVKFMQVGTFVDKIGYRIVYSTLPNKFDTMLSQVQKIIASFKILNPGKGLKVLP